MPRHESSVPIHGYDLVDFEILWQTVVEDLPRLMATLESILCSRGR